MISALWLRAYPHALVGALCLGIAAANLARSPGPLLLGLGVGSALVAPALGGSARARIASLAVALLLAGWWWGSVRLDALDRSALVAQAGRTEPALVVVTGPARRGEFTQRVPAQARRFGLLAVREPVLLQLPLGRAPPQGSKLELVAGIALPRTAEHGFDERTWLRRHGVHVVLRADRYRIVGKRGGLGGLADRLRSRLARSLAPGVGGERRAVLAGIVLGDDAGLSDELRDRFRASGLYHLLSESRVSSSVVAPSGRRYLRAPRHDSRPRPESAQHRCTLRPRSALREDRGYTG